MDDLMGAFPTETKEGLAVPDIELVMLEQNSAAAAGEAELAVGPPMRKAPEADNENLSNR